MTESQQRELNKDLVKLHRNFNKQAVLELFWKWQSVLFYRGWQDKDCLFWGRFGDIDTDVSVRLLFRAMHKLWRFRGAEYGKRRIQNECLERLEWYLRTLTKPINVPELSTSKLSIEELFA